MNTDDKKTIHFAITETISLSDSIGTPSVRTNISGWHFSSAELFARLASNLERDNSTLSDELFLTHKAFVIGSVLSAASFLEATINEFFIDVVDSSKGINRITTEGMNKDAITRIMKMWELEIPKTAAYKIVEKYQIALVLAGKENFDTSRFPFQDVLLLTQLRNALIHYEPEWVTNDITDAKTFSGKTQRRLRGKFPLNPYAAERDAFFPKKCLSAGCSVWAVTSSKKFVNEFFAKIDSSYRV